ncbi:hypothetical protein [Xanthomonas graminis]|uniref:Uncharacterized protein n=2 Tax=Xanthomonas translucens group TaxID=3390202 RepID=A0A199P3J5_9XANT|nr:hypothetical protein [Xanthomonas translucens]OAX55561.1 hypothetical protein A6R73_16410 [Xanthomonas translucens pv. poae]
MSAHIRLHRRVQALLPDALDTRGLHRGNAGAALARSAQAALVTAADRGGALWLRLSERSRDALSAHGLGFLAAALQARAALHGEAEPWRYCTWRALRRASAWAPVEQGTQAQHGPGFVTWEAQGRARLLVLPAQAALLCRWWR